MKLYWVNFIVGGERPCLISHSNPYPTLEKANDSVKNTLESLNVILSYIQEQDTETGKMTPVIVTSYAARKPLPLGMGRKRRSHT